MGPQVDVSQSKKSVKTTNTASKSTTVITSKEKISKKMNKREQTKRMHTIGRKYLAPMVEMIICSLQESFKGEIEKIRIAEAVYHACDTCGKTKKLPSGKTRVNGYLLFIKAKSVEAANKLTFELERRPTQAEIYTRLGSLWREAKHSGEQDLFKKKSRAILAQEGGDEVKKDDVKSQEEETIEGNSEEEEESEDDDEEAF